MVSTGVKSTNPRRRVTGLYYIRMLKDMGYSFGQLVKFSGISKRTIINWYHRKTTPSPVLDEMVCLRIEKRYNQIIKSQPHGQVISKDKKKRRKRANKP